MLGKVYERHPKSLCIYYLYLINIISICNIYVEKAMYMFGETKGERDMKINPQPKEFAYATFSQIPHLKYSGDHKF